jgi:F-box and WD-40 domain protein 1/11
MANPAAEIAMTTDMNDEGYSDNDPPRDPSAVYHAAWSPRVDLPAAPALPDYVVSMSEAQRTGTRPRNVRLKLISLGLTYALLRTLRTSSIATIVKKLDPLLHIDPIQVLPWEITAEIFSYLDPDTLMGVSTLSKIWRIRALDTRLWRSLFLAEGWRVNHRRVWDFEEAERERFYRRKERNLGAMASQDHANWAEQHGEVEADDDRMEDVMDLGSPHRVLPGLRSSLRLPTIPTSASSIKPSLLVREHAQPARINWQYLYKQKRRLENNWLSGRYTNFQLPHPSRPQEAHTERIYTIQYSGRHLVSGSRDKTIRVWSLDSQRLVLPPLRGHSASVLCLQFDPRPSQDVIISGGSDACVIVWRFSTGEILRRLNAPHSESILNLKFDDNYLVTCSKDRSVKVWNRKAMMPTDDAYPIIGPGTAARFPRHIIDVDLYDPAKTYDPLREYSLLMTLVGHTAAVNAITIYDGTVVSISGDRMIKLWNVRTGDCDKTIVGHDKGIACVQFDGRRIISGSSDETVRIFDAKSGTEVSCLRAHFDLVRSVQANFGDMPATEQEDEQAAQELNDRWLEENAGQAQGRRGLTAQQLRERRPLRHDMPDLKTYGAKLPPGGGGSRWARIVTGSYDETVIIWKRNRLGRWVPAHQLFQWDAVIRAGGTPRVIPVSIVPQGRRREQAAQPRQNQANHHPAVVQPAALPAQSAPAQIAPAQIAPPRIAPPQNPPPSVPPSDGDQQQLQRLLHMARLSDTARNPGASSLAANKSESESSSGTGPNSPSNQGNAVRSPAQTYRLDSAPRPAQAGPSSAAVPPSSQAAAGEQNGNTLSRYHLQLLDYQTSQQQARAGHPSRTALYAQHGYPMAREDGGVPSSPQAPRPRDRGRRPQAPANSPAQGQASAPRLPPPPPHPSPPLNGDGSPPHPPARQARPAPPQRPIPRTEAERQQQLLDLMAQDEEGMPPAPPQTYAQLLTPHQNVPRVQPHAPAQPPTGQTLAGAGNSPLPLIMQTNAAVPLAATQQQVNVGVGVAGGAQPAMDPRLALLLRRRAAAAAAAYPGLRNAAQAQAPVYKLQFDSRRIICCSMEPVIVGWDFANGDREIELASEFFGEEQV